MRACCDKRPGRTWWASDRFDRHSAFRSDRNESGGRYFAFDPKRANTKPSRQQFKEGNRRLEIVIHPEYGHPLVLAYRILQHVFLKVTKEGKPFPDVVSFSYREIGRLIGRDVFGGRDVQQIEKAIKQLQSTEVIETTISEKNNKTQSYDRILVTSEVRRQFELVLLQPRFRQ